MTKTSKYCSPTNSKNFYDNITDILTDLEFVRKGKRLQIANVASVFDIEASSFYNENNEKQATMYAWVFGLNGRCIRGRSWGEFLEVIDKICYYYQLNTEKRLIVYVHNLSYEFQWFKRYFDWYKVFSIDTRKPIYAISKCGIEFRCSYLLSGYSLEVLGENLTKYKVSKMVGDLDYKLLRGSKTPLTDKEWGYILNDGLVVMAYIQEEIERLGSIVKIPLTKTGYVRDLCRQRCLKGEGRFEYSKLMRSLKIDVDDYHQLKRAFTGGFTHANVHYVGIEVHDVHSFDFSSSYPAVMLSEKYPMSSPRHVYIKDEKDFVENLKAFCCMFNCKFYNIRSKVNYDNYISISRCYEKENYITNNGRLVEADMIKTTLTEQDFFIIAQMYDWDSFEVSDFKIFYKDYLPKDFIMTILDLYKDKTELKGVSEKIAEYFVSKGMINSCYGMCVTDPCRDENLYEDNNWITQKADVETLINKYNKDPQRFLYYPWGVWVTAYARRNLFSGIAEFQDDYVYSDTDSIKVKNIEKHRDYIERYNKKITEKIYACLDNYGIDHKYAHPKTIKGVEKPLGVWDYEGMYTRFKTLGAKRYIVEEDGDIAITIAGVSKRAGKRYLKWKYKTNDKIFSNFVENITFPASYDRDGVDDNGSGKLCHTYIDVRMCGELTDYLGNTMWYDEESGIHMENTEYTLSLDDEFKKLLQGIKGGHLV